MTIATLLRRSGSGRVVAVLAYLFRIPPVAGPSQKGGWAVTLVSSYYDEEEWNADFERREQLACLIALQKTIWDYSIAATHYETIEESTLTKICEFLNALLAVAEVVNDEARLKGVGWSETSLSAFREIAAVINEIIDDLSLRPAIAALHQKVSSALPNSNLSPFDYIHFYVDEAEQDEDSESLAEMKFGFGQIELRSKIAPADTASERPFDETVAFHALDDGKFFRLVRSLATVAMELSNTVPSRADPRFLQKVTRVDLPPQDFVPTPLQIEILRTLDGKAMTKQALADKVCKGDSSRLYKRGGIKELMELRKVTNKTSVGYYRPDRPPKWE